MFLIQNLNYLKEQSSMSFQKLSLLCGVKQTTLKYVFTEKTANPSFEVVIALAKFFNVSLDDLVYKDLSQEKNDKLRR